MNNFQWREMEDTPISSDQQMAEMELKRITATAGQRIGSFLLDVIIVGLLEIPVSMWVLLEVGLKEFIRGESSIFETQKYIFYIVYNIVIWLLYYIVYPIYSKGRTLGKQIIGTRIVAADGNIVNHKAIIIRYGIVFFLLLLNDIPFFTRHYYSIFLLISLILVFTDQFRRALHDIFAGTIVVRERGYQEFNNRFKGIYGNIRFK